MSQDKESALRARNVWSAPLFRHFTANNLPVEQPSEVPPFMNNNILALSILIMALPCIASEPSPAPAAAPTGSAVAPSHDNTGPRITFDQTSYDFGKVESGELIKHTFFFTNTGNALLEVS